MYAYITSGTYEFLKKLEEKHSTEKMMFMQSAQTAQLLHETNGPTLFQSPRKYEVIESAGEFSKKGFIACNNIPVSDEGRPVFEYGFTNRAHLIEKEPGFIALRVLRPLSSDTYVVMTVWDDEKSYRAWKKSKSFNEAHNHSSGIKAAESTNVFSGPSYVSTFVIAEEDITDTE